MSTPSDPPPDEPSRPSPAQAWGHPTEPGWGRPEGQAEQPAGQPGPQAPYAAQAYPPMPMAPPQHPSTSTAMGLGIFALVGGFLCALPILAGPFAWAVGHKAVREIDAEPGTWSGREMANAGMILGIVATFLLCIGLLALVLLLAFVIAIPW